LRLAYASPVRGIDPIAELRAAIEQAVAGLGSGDGTSARLERPPKAELGDYSTNAAMLLAPVLGAPPREIAERLVQSLDEGLADALDHVEVAGPGFLNLFLSDHWYRRAVAALVAAGEEVGGSPSDHPELILIEFVSANPTGPLTAASGRHAAYGDSVGRLLAYTGEQVEREYYVNDVGGQIDRFGESIGARMTGSDRPDDGYEGEYVTELAVQLAAEGIEPGDTQRLARSGAERMRVAAEETLRRYGVEFDRWSSERQLHEGGELKRVLADLERSGHVYGSEGAIWLRTTDLGDDKDRVLLRSGGEPTYYLSDLAYHRAKLERGAERLIDVLGADHHGYVARLEAGIAALGYEPDRLEIAIVQLVHVVEGGDRAQMSKRKGEFVTLDELIDDIGADAARFFMLQRGHQTTLDLDLDLARRQSNDNPVYYVQYAHARIASILRKAARDGAAASLATNSSPADLHPAERALIKRLLELRGEIDEAASRRAPHRLCAYAIAAASDFHAFYRDCQVLGVDDDRVEAERITLCLLTKRAIATTLALLGISAPERM
jgi:arginyl-tRNA synthetase